MGLLEITVVGVLLSMVIEFLKRKLGTKSGWTKLLTVVLAIVVGAAIYFLEGSEFWTTTISVLTTASAVYAFILK